MDQTVGDKQILKWTRQMGEVKYWNTVDCWRNVVIGTYILKNKGLGSWWKVTIEIQSTRQLLKAEY